MVEAAADDVVLVPVLREEDVASVVDVESSETEEEVAEDNDEVSVAVVLRSVEELSVWELLVAVEPTAVVAVVAVAVFVDAAVVLAGGTVVVVVSVCTTGSHKNSTACPTKIFPINELKSAVSRLHARWTAD